jgi:membrane protease YdiL (CAAX protease family)
MNNMLTTDLNPQSPDRKMLASVRHTVVLVIILLIICLGGMLAQKQQAAGSGIQQHPSTAPLYLSLIVFEWLLVFFVWRGVRKRKIRISDLVGGKWSNWRSVLTDVVIALCFMAIWTGVEHIVNYFTGDGSSKLVDTLLPRGFAEIVIWVMLSLSAGFCEELVYRGYLQGQMLAMTGSPIAAVIIQGVLFGISHAYQGLKLAIMISVLGILYGILASWRRSLRPGMINHALTDILGGLAVKLF